MNTQAREATLYTLADCAYCEMLKLRLLHERITYLEVDDPAVIRQKGFETVPRLVISGHTFSFDQAIAWLNQRGRPAS
ncbi:MAG: glutaredoxin [Clostridiales bacterium]|nr:glutaredoxin [Clostridiales bacterium]